MILILERLGQSFQRYYSNSTTKHAALRLSIEGATFSIRRDDAPFFVDISRHMWYRDGAPSRQSKIAFIVEQALAGQVDCH